ncbi:MAG: flagellar basal body rod protein FlgB [Acidobacteriota bacterium]
MSVTARGGFMGEIVSDAAIMAALGRQMTRAVQRQAVAAGNLANVDTPGYRTQSASFDDALGEHLDEHLDAGQMVATNARHIGAGSGTADRGKTVEPTGLAERRDGNNVQMDRELLALGRSAADFSAAQTVLSAKFRLVRYAINEGR